MVKGGKVSLLTRAELCVKLCVMKVSTVREVQHNFSSLLRLVSRGEEIEVYSRKKLVARIVPPQVGQSPFQPVDWSDLPSLLHSLWKGKMVHGSSTGKVLDDLRGER
jgi:antitoxin (DNA-binding transcriptional repressor) of toxin-antitoxin stability system